jgi:thioredoxin reductase
MKSVCIIGAGPAGLVAAKTFLQKGGYCVTVFEASDRAGGMWRAQSGEYGEKCSPEMRTNLSRFTVAFSDLSWASVDLSDPVTGATSPSALPIFPKAWQVGRYLAQYARKFDVDARIKYNHRVLNAKYLDNSRGWEIRCLDSMTDQHSTQHFDYLIVASGFFDRPISSFGSLVVGSKNFQHSSRFRSLSTLTGKAGRIVVIGGGISGSEAAAHAALQISSAKYSPRKGKSDHSNSTIYHIFNRPFYCLPRYIPQSSSSSDQAPRFLPLDLVLYNLSRRGGGEISAAISTVPAEKAEKGHQFMRSVIGGDQGDIGRSELAHTQSHTQFPGYTGITDTYSEFVRSGIIVPVRGWVENVESEERECFSIIIKPKAPWAEDLEADVGVHLSSPQPSLLLI